MNKQMINQITKTDVAEFRLMFHGDGGALNAYQQIATKSAIYPGKGTAFGLMYAALGLAEAGEVQNKVKKAFRDDGVVGSIEFFINSDNTEDRSNAVVRFNPLTPERREQIIKEMGGALWYISAMCNEIGATMSEVALMNLEELQSRCERDTLRGDGDDR